MMNYKNNYMIIYKHDSDDICSRLIKKIAKDRYRLNFIGPNSKNDDDFTDIAFYLIDYIKIIDDDTIEIKHIRGKPVTITNPKIIISYDFLHCDSCIYACQTQYIPAEYFEEEPRHIGFCMMTGKQMDCNITYGHPCKFYTMGENNVKGEYD